MESHDNDNVDKDVSFCDNHDIQKNIQQQQQQQQQTSMFTTYTKEEEEKEEVEACSKVNVVLLVNKSHVDRMIDYLHQLFPHDIPTTKDKKMMLLLHHPTIDIISIQKDSRRKNINLMLLSVHYTTTHKHNLNNEEEEEVTQYEETKNADLPTKLVQHLQKQTFLKTALNKCFVVHSTILTHTTTFTNTNSKKKSKSQTNTTNYKNNTLMQRIIAYLLLQKKRAKKKQMRVRIQSYPTNLQSLIATNLHDCLEEQHQHHHHHQSLSEETQIILDPVNFTHVLSVVRIHSNDTELKDNYKEEEEEEEDQQPSTTNQKKRQKQKHLLRMEQKIIIDRREIFMVGISNSCTFGGNLNQRLYNNLQQQQQHHHHHHQQQQQQMSNSNALRDIENKQEGIINGNNDDDNDDDFSNMTNSPNAAEKSCNQHEENEKKTQKASTKKQQQQEETNPEINRAYYKLHEAFERYFHPTTTTKTVSNSIFDTIPTKQQPNIENSYYSFNNNNNNKSKKISFTNSIALDVGAAPGGWTKYLLNHVGCKRVYAVDPARLSPDVLSMTSSSPSTTPLLFLLSSEKKKKEEIEKNEQVVIHIAKQIKDALPILQKDILERSKKEDKVVSNALQSSDTEITSFLPIPSTTLSSSSSSSSSSSLPLIDIYVSDMCLNEMSQQLQYLHEIKTKWNLLAPNAFFVLTLKCIVGHSKQAFEEQVESVVNQFLMVQKGKDLGEEQVRNGSSHDDDDDDDDDDDAGAKLEVYGVKIIHLFSNRKGERTVMGYLK